MRGLLLWNRLIVFDPAAIEVFHFRNVMTSPEGGSTSAHTALASTINGLVEEFFQMLGDGEASMYTHMEVSQNKQMDGLLI